MEARDPRTHPQPGDEIRQLRSHLHLRVISVTNDQVTWQRKRYGMWDDTNSWTIRGWIDVVAKGARVIHAAQPAQEQPHGDL